MKKQKSKKKAGDKIFIISMVIVFLIIAIIIALTYKAPQKKSIAATVNGESIYYDELNTQYNRVPAQLQQTFSKETLLQQMIDRKLVLQEAAKANVQVKEEEVDSMIDQIKSQLPENTSFEDVLANEKITLDEVRKEIKDQLIIAAFLENNVIKNIEVKKAEIDDYINTNFGDKQISNETVAQVEKLLLLQKQKKTYEIFLNQTKLASDIKVFKEGEKTEEPKAVAVKTEVQQANATLTVPTLGECLNSKNAVLYGSGSCEFCTKQLVILGQDASKIKFVECEQNGTMTEECVSAGIEVYPTWKIDSTNYKGTRTLEQLKEISGC